MSEKIIRPIIFMSRTAGEVADPAVRDFRPANAPGTAPRTVEPVVESTPSVEAPQMTTSQQVEFDPKGSNSSATGSASSSASENNGDSTPKDETSNPNSSSESSADPAAAEKAKLLLHPSTSLGKIKPPAVE